VSVAVIQSALKHDVSGAPRRRPGMRHTVTPSTVAALKARRVRPDGNTLTLRALARELGFPPSYEATLSAVLRGAAGHVGLEAENELRRALGLPAVGTVAAPVCPSCGSDHRLPDCKGQEVQFVRRRRKARRWRDLPLGALRDAIRNRVPYSGGPARTNGAGRK
jgi:hypothetical protein